MQNELKAQRCTTSDMVKYSLGACVESLVLNSFFGFAMFYYTKALGLSPKYAGWAAFIPTIWDGIADLIMGHISDNTRSRFGKRHLYMAVGGIVMITTYFFLWYVPAGFKSSEILLFCYLLAINLLLRTAYAMFVVPYTALSFEICSDYADRTRIQGIRSALNMAANLCGCAMAWTLFFGDDSGATRAANIPQNYLNMGTTFTLASFVFLFLMLAFTKKHIRDSRNDTISGNTVDAFFKDVKETISDKYPRWVFLFLFVVMLGIILVGFMQMYVFEDFMVFSGWQKTVAHGGTMVGMGLGSLFGAVLVRRLDKKGAICIGVFWSVFCELVLASLFLTGFLKPDQTLGVFPISFVLFSFFHGAYWFGNGVMMPISISMMADVSEIHQLETGINKDGSYAAMYTLATKIAVAIGLLVSGYCLSWVGYVTGPEAITQSPEVIWRICAMTLVVGPLTSLMASGLIMRYPVNKAFIEKLRKQASPQS